MNIHWDDIRFLLHVSRFSKLAKAAQHMAQDTSTVSRRLKRLESELGMLLFERTRQGHVLTRDGQKVVERAEIIEQNIQDIVALSERADNRVSGRVRIGVTEGLGAAVLAPAIADFSREYPAVELDLIAMSGFANVSRREADLAILLARPTAGRLRVRKLSDYTLKLYASADYLATANTPTTEADLKDHPLIGYVDELIYSPQLRYYSEVSADLKPTLCSPSIVAQLEMVRSGAGIAILPCFMAEQHDDLVCVLPDSVSVTRSFWLVTHEDVASLARVKAASEFIERTVKRLE